MPLTVALESILASHIIDPCECRDMAIVNILLAFLYVEIPRDKLVILKLTDKYVDISCAVYPDHSKNIVLNSKMLKRLEKT